MAGKADPWAPGRRTCLRPSLDQENTCLHLGGGAGGEQSRETRPPPPPRPWAGRKLEAGQEHGRRPSGRRSLKATKAATKLNPKPSTRAQQTDSAPHREPAAGCTHFRARGLSALVSALLQKVSGIRPRSMRHAAKRRQPLVLRTSPESVHVPPVAVRARTARPLHSAGTPRALP